MTGVRMIGVRGVQEVIVDVVWCSARLRVSSGALGSA